MARKIRKLKFKKRMRRTKRSSRRKSRRIFRSKVKKVITNMAETKFIEDSEVNT